MSTVTPELIRSCRRCASDLAPGALVCEKCHALVHSEQLDQLASEAKALEANHDYRAARERWLMGLAFLPANSRQADWIKSHAHSLDALAEQVQPQPKS